MTAHTSNIKAFVDASKNIDDPAIKAYLGLVAVELILKESTNLKNHDVPAALHKFSHLFAQGKLKGCSVKINSLAIQLKRDLNLVTVQDKNRNPCVTPSGCYPYLRYVRYEVDGWPAPSTTDQAAKNLSNTVIQIQAYLKEKFKKDL